MASANDRSGTNPATLRDTFDMGNVFASVDEGLFVDHASWSYAQALLSHHLRARVTLPMVVANVTGRTEAGLGDVQAGAEWLGLQRGRFAIVLGTVAGFDTSTNDALADRLPTVTPHATLVVVADDHSLFSVRYAYRVSLGSEVDRPDIAASTLEATAVRRFANGTWLRAIPALVIDHERGVTHGHLDAEWGRVLAGGFSTWVRGGRALGSDEARPDRWTLAIGIRLVL